MELIGLRRIERAEFLRTLVEVGPDSPTLCSGWSACDIAAHLVAAERYAGLPLAATYPLRSVLPAPVVVRAMRSMAPISQRELTRAKRRGWEWLLNRLAGGPPVGFRWGSISLVRLVEEWIHHEDVRRANAMPIRETRDELYEALWQAGLLLTDFGEFQIGRQGIEAVLPDGRTKRIGDTSRVRIEGTPGEILRFVAGRTADAQVTVRGDKQDLDALALAV